MRSDAENMDYLRENLRYELLMLRHTLAKITTLTGITAQDQMDWNAYFELFAIHARNLHTFLKNKETQNASALHFTPQFKATKSNDAINMFNKLNPQLLHLGWKRPTDPSQKANVDGAKLLTRWIETEFARFIGGLGGPYCSAWNPDDADPSKIKLGSPTVVLGATGPAAPTTTNAPTSAVTTKLG